MTLWLQVLLLTLNLTSLVLHGNGIYLLMSLYKRCRCKIQQTFLIHLSLSECLVNIIEISKTIIMITMHGNELNAEVNILRQYLLIMQLYGVWLIFYFLMTYLTIDRLMNAVLNVRYPLYWDSDKTKKLLVLTWIIGGLIAITVGIMKRFFNINLEKILFTYCYPVLQCFYVSIAVTTYTVIFRKYKQSHAFTKQEICLAQVHIYKVKNAYYVFRNSKFFIAVLLISTFLVFIVAADLVYLFVKIVNGNDSIELQTACYISYAISNVIDACIYIFLQKDVRQLLLTKLRLTTQRLNSVRTSQV